MKPCPPAPLLREPRLHPPLHPPTHPSLLPSPPAHMQALFKSTVQLVLLPTVLGLLANEYFKKQVGEGRSCWPDHRGQKRGWHAGQWPRGAASRWGEVGVVQALAAQTDGGSSNLTCTAALARWMWCGQPCPWWPSLSPSSCARCLWRRWGGVGGKGSGIG